MDQRLQDSDSRQNPAQTQEEGKLDGPKSKPDARRQWQDDAFSGEKMGCQCGGHAFSSTFDIEQQKNDVMKMGKLQKQTRQSNFCLRFSPQENRLQQSESANVGPQTWRAEHFWSRDVSEHVSATCLPIDHKATFSLSAHLRDQKDVLGEHLEPTEIRLENAQKEGFKWEKEDLCPAGSHRSLRCTSLFARSTNENHFKRD